MDVDEYARGGGVAIFMEITDREDLGADLRAPQADEGGGNRDWLITEPLPGDLVLHYHRPSGGITAISTVAGPPEDGPMLWAAKGASARSKDVEPYERPAWIVPLTGHELLASPLAQSDVVEARDDVLSVKAELEDEFGTGLHFPYAPYGDDGLRAFQAYLTIYPRELLPVFPALAEQVESYEARGPGHIETPDPDPPEPDLFLANEDVTVNRPEVADFDPEAMTKANRLHAKTQNQLRTWVLNHDAELTPPLEGANVDLAWLADGRQWIGEVKSLNSSNEAHQLRYGLGQLLDYRYTYTDAGNDVRAALFIPRPPTRRSWIQKCSAVGVELCWPGRWPG